MNWLNRLAFQAWYFSRPPWDTGISPPELLEYIRQHPAGRALDLGCGTGTNVLTLARAGWTVTGVDFVPRAVKTALRKVAAAGAQADVRFGDVTDLRGITGPFDLALDIGCFHSPLDRRAYLVELRRLLAPGGHWLMYGFFKPAAARAQPGLGAPDLDLIAAHGLIQLWRRDGTDKRQQPSAWFLYQVPGESQRNLP
jgi:SAM-dependent methyltransferase